MSFPSLSQFDLTTLNLCESILDCSNNPTAIKFMQIAPEIFPQFMNRNNNNSNNNNSNCISSNSSFNPSIRSIRHQSDTDTTNSNETVYSQDEIKAAQQLLNMHSFIQSNSNPNTPLHSNSNRHCKISIINRNHKKNKKNSKHKINKSKSKHKTNKSNSKIDSRQKHKQRHKNKKFKKINNINHHVDINSFSLLLSDLQCIEKNFHLKSSYIESLDLKCRRGDITYPYSLLNIYPYICNYNECFELFKTKSLLQSHSILHKYLKCQICNKGFNKKNNANKNILYQHIKNNHNMYYCIKCKNIYQTFIQLQKHKCLFKNAIHKHSKHSKHTKVTKHKHTTNKKEKPFKCKICNKGFVSKSNLQKHQMVHNGEKKFKCKYCNKGYIQKWRCKKHMEQCQ